jgi:hypothetical protein
MTNVGEEDYVRSGVGRYAFLPISVGVLLLLALRMPLYALITPIGFTAWFFVTTIVRRTTSITFTPDGVDVGLLFRSRHLRKPVTEFDGSRFLGLRIRDLRTGKTYDVPASRRLIDAAERHGYPVVRRPKMAAR